MVRVLNFLCVLATAASCLALNRVADETRVAEARLHRTQLEIAKTSDGLKILQADWERAANPGHIQVLAAARLGLADTATMAVASLELLPRRGESGAPSNTGAITTSTSVPPSLPGLVRINTGE